MNKADSIKEKLQDLNGDEYDLAVLDYLSDLYFLKQPLNAKQRQVLATHFLDMEVNNGGFDQFYLNNDLEFIDDAIEGLRAFASLEFVDLATRSKAIYLRDKERFAEERNPAFDPLDEQFYALDHYAEGRVQYIHDNLDDIIH